MTLPLPFSKLPNDMMGSPPLLAKNNYMQAMFIKGERVAQQRFCDATLNRFPNPSCVFVVLTDLVLVTTISCSEMRSLNPIDALHGYTSEVDVAFWSLVQCRFADGRPSELMWHPSFMFVDSGPAMASGREIYGYPKAVSTINRHATKPSRPDLSVDTLHLPVFKRDQVAEIGRIVEILTTSSVREDSLLGKAEFSLEILNLLGFAIPSIGENIPLPSAGMPQVMLRQIRDATRAGMASLKEVLLVKPTPFNFGNFGTFNDPIEIVIMPSASHNLTKSMGLKARNKVSLGLWLTFDFEVGWARRLI